MTGLNSSASSRGAAHPSATCVAGVLRTGACNALGNTCLVIVALDFFGSGRLAPRRWGRMSFDGQFPTFLCKFDADRRRRLGV
jgi:hypothetical protein